MGLFDNREIAIAIWAVFLAAWLLFSARRSSAPGRLLKAFAQKQIRTALALMTLYIVLMVVGLRAVGLWDIGQLKNTILWSLFVAPVSLFRINSIADDPHYYRNAIKDNLSLVVVLEFVIAFFTFDLWVELLIVPLTAVFAAMLAVAESRKEHANVAHLLNTLLALFGLGLIVYAAYGLIADFRFFATMQTLSDFYLPPVLSLLFLPFLFVLALYVSYENAFVSLRFSLKNPALESYAKRRAFLRFHVNTRLLNRWTRNLNIATPRSRREVDDSIREVKTLYARESNAPDVPYESGWSPYHACEFLVTEGLHAGDYHKGFEGWWASSPYHEVGDTAIVRNSIAYYIEGGEFAATTLKLVLNVNEPKSAQEARERFINMAQMLFECALGSAMPDNIERLLSSETGTVLKLHGKEIVIVKDPWPGHHLGGYELNFIIRNSASGT
jgi:hypothetical protein